VQLQGDGPVRLLVVECDATLSLRATAQWSSDASLLPADADLAALAGGAAHARLAITVDPKDGGPLYQGIVGLEAESIAALIRHYLKSSEQIDSRLVLAVADHRSRGILLQRLPSADPGPDEDVTWQRAAASADAISVDGLLEAADAETLLRSAFADDDIRLFKAHPTRFFCGCSEERIASALRLLGRREVESILAERGVFGATCEFCNRQYILPADAARAPFASVERGVPTDAENHLPTEALRH
jgi:molecular chaperone Hsp33